MYCASLCAKGSDCQLLALSSASWSPSVPPVTSQASFTAFARLIPLRSSQLLCSLGLSLWRLATSLRAALPVSIPWSHYDTNSPWALRTEACCGSFYTRRTSEPLRGPVPRDNVTDSGSTVLPSPRCRQNHMAY